MMCGSRSHIQAEDRRVVIARPSVRAPHGSREEDHARCAYKAIDLFAGIGGIRLGFARAFGDMIETVLVSEKDKFARQTYIENFGDDCPMDTDIKALNAESIPDFDILLGGFPCQPFSIAGVSKKNSLGRAHGFADKTSGTLFFDVARIIDAKRPTAFMLENVKNLRSHDEGRTWKVIEQTLAEDLGYHIHPMILDAADWTCQHRERIYIVGFNDDVPFSWGDLQRERVHDRVGDILFDNDEIPEKYTMTDRMWSCLQRHAQRHAAKGNGFGYGLVTPDTETTKTLSARYYKDGSEILVEQAGRNPRRLVPRECARLQGFPDEYRIVVSDTQAYKQFGNSVSVPVVAAVAQLMRNALES